MAQKTVTRSFWLVASFTAAGTLLWLALIGERPATHVARFEAAGVMRHVSLHEIYEVEIASGTRSWRFTKDPAGWTAVGATAALPFSAGSVDKGLRLLRDSAPERVLAGSEPHDLAAYGLDPPVLAITVRGRATFSVAFGTANPLGLARYARVSGSADILLLPGYIADTWEQAVGLRPN